MGKEVGIAGVRRHFEESNLIGEVVSIQVAPKAGDPLHALEVATLESGEGVKSDRYFQGQGTFSEDLKGSQDWEVTLIELEEIDSYNQVHGTKWSMGDFRRNIITRGIRLNDLVGERFYVGACMLEGIRLCEPCAHLGTILGNEIVKGMVHRSGLRARIVRGGDIRSGDAVEHTGTA